jgi:hypothetical protein
MNIFYDPAHLNKYEYVQLLFNTLSSSKPERNCTSPFLFQQEDELFLTTNSPIYAPLAHVKVKDILDQSSKVWNAPLIYNIFFYHNAAQLILNTHLQHLVNEDKLIWKAEKNGKYSMHSSCRICVNEIVDNSRLHLPSRWNLVW